VAHELIHRDKKMSDRVKEFEQDLQRAYVVCLDQLHIGQLLRIITAPQGWHAFCRASAIKSRVLLCHPAVVRAIHFLWHGELLHAVMTKSSIDVLDPGDFEEDDRMLIAMKEATPDDGRRRKRSVMVGGPFVEAAALEQSFKLEQDGRVRKRHGRFLERQLTHFEFIGLVVVFELAVIFNVLLMIARTFYPPCELWVVQRLRAWETLGVLTGKYQGLKAIRWRSLYMLNTGVAKFFSRFIVILLLTAMLTSCATTQARRPDVHDLHGLRHTRNLSGAGDGWGHPEHAAAVASVELTATKPSVYPHDEVWFTKIFLVVVFLGAWWDEKVDMLENTELYFSDFLKPIEFTSYTLVTVGIASDLYYEGALTGNEPFLGISCAAVAVAAAGLWVVWGLRFLMTTEKIGLLVLMLNAMVYDVVQWACILMVLTWAFAVLFFHYLSGRKNKVAECAEEGLPESLFPEGEAQSVWVLLKIALAAADPPLECLESSKMIATAMACYMIIAIILLLNMLIAMSKSAFFINPITPYLSCLFQGVVTPFPNHQGTGTVTPL